MTSEKELDEAGEITEKVFAVLFTGCVLFMIATVLIGIFEFIPMN